MANVGAFHRRQDADDDQEPTFKDAALDADAQARIPGARAPSLSPSGARAGRDLDFLALQRRAGRACTGMGAVGTFPCVRPSEGVPAARAVSCINCYDYDHSYLPTAAPRRSGGSANGEGSGLVV